MTNSIFKGSALTRVLKLGLIFWIRKQCKEISELSIDINKIKIGLNNFRISQIMLSASFINFKDILINNINLEATDLILRLDLKKPIKNSITIDENFKIKANILFDQEDLITTIKSNQWFSLKNWIQVNLLENKPISKIIIKNKQLIFILKDKINNKSTEKYFSIKAKNGKLFFNQDGILAEHYLPIEESIYINQANIENELLSIHISSNIRT